jgi:hypothetical protein
MSDSSLNSRFTSLEKALAMITAANLDGEGIDWKSTAESMQFIARSALAQHREGTGDNRSTAREAE